MTASPNRMLAILLGAAFILIGLGGFPVTIGVGFIAVPGGLLLGVFEVNPLQNLVHALIGVVLLVSGIAGARVAKTVNAIVGTACLMLGLVGLFIVGTPFNALALNGADNVLHFGTSVLLLAVGLGAERLPSKPAA